MRDRIKTYVGVLRDNTAIVASVALFFLWLGITFQVPDFAVDGTFEPGLVAPWIVVAFCYALGYLVAVLWYRKIASLFLRRRFLVLVCLVMAAGVTIDIASSWNTDFFGSVSRVAYVGSILMSSRHNPDCGHDGFDCRSNRCAKHFACFCCRNACRGNAYGCLGLYGSMGQRHCSPFCSAGDDPR